MLDLLQHVFIKQIVGKEKILQKQLIELIDLNQQIGVIEKTRYCPSATRFLSTISRYTPSYSHTFLLNPMKNVKSASRPVTGFYVRLQLFLSQITPLLDAL